MKVKQIGQNEFEYNKKAMVQAYSSPCLIQCVSFIGITVLCVTY